MELNITRWINTGRSDVTFCNQNKDKFPYRVIGELAICNLVGGLTNPTLTEL